MTEKTSNNAIYLKELFPIENINEYKVHFGHKTQEVGSALDEWVADENNWKLWQEKTHRI